MILSDLTLRELLKSGELVVEPLEDYLIQPASIDLRLGNHFLKIDENVFDIIRLDDPIKYMEVTMDEIIIPPFSFLLASGARNTVPPVRQRSAPCARRAARPWGLRPR